MSSAAPATKAERGPGRAILVLLVLALAAIASMAVFVSRPQRATRLILQHTGRALGLEITASAGTYRLSGTPFLVVHDVVAREPGARTPILRARQASLSLPWSTIRARGNDLTVQRIELDRPVLDLAALQHWLQLRPPGKTRVPTLTDGLRIRDGTLIGDGWRLAAIDLRLPTLAPARRVSAHVDARYVSSGLQVPIDVDMVMSTPAPDAAIGIAGTLAIERPEWRMPAHVVLSGAMRSGGGLRLRRMKLSASARYDADATHAPFALGAGGTLHFDDGVRLAPAAISLRAQGLVPTLDANGTLALNDGLGIALDGALATWPAAWPELPAPLGQSRSPLPFKLRYAGSTDFSDITRLQLQRDQASFDGRFRLGDVTGWIDSGSKSPLPPMDGRLEVSRVEIAGARLEGVEATLDDETLSETIGAATP